MRVVSASGFSEMNQENNCPCGCKIGVCLGGSDVYKFEINTILGGLTPYKLHNQEWIALPFKGTVPYATPWTYVMSPNGQSWAYRSSDGLLCIIRWVSNTVSSHFLERTRAHCFDLIAVDFISDDRILVLYRRASVEPVAPKKDPTCYVVFTIDIGKLPNEQFDYMTDDQTDWKTWKRLEAPEHCKGRAFLVLDMRATGDFAAFAVRDYHGYEVWICKSDFSTPFLTVINNSGIQITALCISDNEVFHVMGFEPDLHLRVSGISIDAQEITHSTSHYPVLPRDVTRLHTRDGYSVACQTEQYNSYKWVCRFTRKELVKELEKACPSAFFSASGLVPDLTDIVAQYLGADR